MTPPATAALPSAATSPPRRDARVITLAALVLAGGAAFTAAEVSWRQGLLWLLGGALGLSLYHASFGFTAAYRRLLVERRGDGVRAQMLMLAIAVTLFFPVLATGSLFGLPVHGFLAPAGVSVAVGAFLFGVGMQLGGGCGSGTLFSVGGGSTRMVVTLAFFVAGALLGTAHGPFWAALPNLGRVSLLQAAGWEWALVLHLAAFAGFAFLTVILERRAHGSLAVGPPHRSVLYGPWPLAWGAIALALGNFATLALVGRPWGVTGAFSLWGAKVADAVGVDVAAWPAFAKPAAAAALQAGVIHDATSVMDFGIMAGALLASGLAGRFAPVWRIPARSLLAATLGGLLLGYGAYIAAGCNIGAFFSGVASGSLHGWVWIAAALAGNYAGTWLRPLFGFPRR